ncbi:MAG: iron-containing alcohol dehydrogenase [Spirochaetes bacterium]|nr:iron-containing alcohol dehydrogenase [Spirochaetota bacterium]
MYITDFSLNLPQNILFGKNSFKKLPALIPKYGKNVLILTGKKSFFQTIHWRNKLKNQLEKGNIQFIHQTVSGEPTVSDIDQKVIELDKTPIDLVISIGGGSVMDTGKAVSAMLKEKKSIIHFLEGVGDREPSGDKVPHIAIPTTAGTGSEVTKNAVISQVGEQGFKKSLRHDHYIPDIAIIDPELYLNCPLSIAASCGMDMFSQLLESYLSIKGNYFTDNLAENAIRLIVDAFIPSITTHADQVEYKSKMAYATMISGITLANAGLGSIHGIAGIMGGFFLIPHGVICGTLLGEVNSAMIDILLDKRDDPVTLQKYLAIGKLFSQNSEDEKEILSNLLKVFENWLKVLDMPRFSQYGLTEDDLKKVAEKSSNKNNPIQFSNDELFQLLKKRL